MHRYVTSVNADDTLESVEAILDSHSLTFVPVIASDGSCFGVISCADILRFHNLHGNLKTKKAWEACSHQVIQITPNTSTREAAELIIKHKIHHLIVMDGDSMQGIVSPSDLLQDLLELQDTGLEVD